MKMVNLLKETEQALANHRFSWNGVHFICNSAGYIDLADFTRVAATITYDADHGDVHIDPTLKIVGSYWWFERGNYDGLEGWVFCQKPKAPTLRVPELRLTTDALSIAEIEANEYKNRFEYCPEVK